MKSNGFRADLLGAKVDSTRRSSSRARYLCKREGRMLLGITSAMEGITFMRNPCRVLPEFIVLFVCALIIGSSPGLAQEEKKGAPEWKPAILPADALAYGEALNDHA